MKDFLKAQIIGWSRAALVSIAIVLVLAGVAIILDQRNQKEPRVAPSPEARNNKVYITMDVLQSLADFYVATVTVAQEEDDFTGTMTALLNQNKYLESGRVYIKDYLNNSNEVIQLTAQGMTLGADMVIKANTEVVQFIRRVNPDDPDVVQEFQYVVAKYLSDQKEGYKMISISAPQITSLLFEPAKTKNPTGKIPYTITMEERERLLEEIERLFGKELKVYREDVKNKSGSYNAILFSADAIRNNLVPDTYEEARELENKQ